MSLKRILETQLIKENDDDVAEYAFQVFTNKLLSDIATGKVNAKDVAKQELEYRGCDINGKWVGFK